MDYTGKKSPQIFSYCLSILEPPRNAMEPMSGFKSTNPQVCCCVDQGTTSLSVQYDKNMAQPGDVVNLQISVDNSACKKGVEAVRVNLVKHLFAESNGGHARNWKTSVTTSQTARIPSGGRQQFQMAVQIPPISNPTAIGHIVANYYTLDVLSDVEGCFCCGDNIPEVEGHLMITTPNPEIMKKEQMTPPPGWNPTASPVILYGESKPYGYIHNSRLHAISNRPSVYLY